MNSSKEFLETLAEELRYLPAKQVNEVLKHYRDKINVETDYGTPIEKVLESMKSPAEIAKGIYEMHGVNYLAKRKRRTKIKDIFSASFSGIIGILCFVLYFFISYFFENVMINQFGLIVNAFTFDSVLDIILTSLCVFSYILVMLVVFIFITDLFIILLNGLLGKILDARESTRGVNYDFMDFTFNAWFNNKFKKDKILFKILFGLVVAFVLTGISSYATNGYINRTIRNIPSNIEVIELEQSFNKIYLNANEVDVVIVEDKETTKPTINYSYEFSKYNYSVENNTLSINVEKNKTYDFLGIIQAPSSKITISVPVGFTIDNILVELNYGDVYLKKLTKTNTFTVTVLNGGVYLGENSNITSGNVNLSVGNIVSNKNLINELTINHGSGQLNSGQDYITKLTHNNGSSDIKTVGSSIQNYTLNNTSGTVYLEDIDGDTLTINTRASVNTLYDIYYRVGDFKIDNVCNFNMTRSSFSEKLTTLSNNKSEQNLDYIKAPNMEIQGLNGRILCSNINTDYKEAINNFEPEYRERIYKYNGVKVNAELVRLVTYDAAISLENLKANKLYFEQTRDLSLIEEIEVVTAEMIYLSAASNVYNFNAETIEMKIDSRSITDKASIDFKNDVESDLIMNVEIDGISEFVTSNNFIVNIK